MFQNETKFSSFNAVAPSGQKIHCRQQVDLVHLMAHTMTGELGDCWTQSMRLYMKLKKAGAVRVRGTRVTDRERDPTNPSPHYWVENNGMVFEKCMGVSQIFKRADFYEGMVIQNAEVAKWGMCFDDEVPAGQGEKVKRFNDKELMDIIEWLEKK